MNLDELDDLDKLFDNILTVRCIYKYLFFSANKFKYLSKIKIIKYILIDIINIEERMLI